MITKTLLGLAGAAAVTAAAALPGTDHGSTARTIPARAVEEASSVAPVARKGDLLLVTVDDCSPACPPTARATMAAGRWMTVERRAGGSSSVLIRIPVADLAAAELVSRVFAAAPLPPDLDGSEQSARR